MGGSSGSHGAAARKLHWRFGPRVGGSGWVLSGALPGCRGHCLVGSLGWVPRRLGSGWLLRRHREQLVGRGWLAVGGWSIGKGWVFGWLAVSCRQLAGCWWPPAVELQALAPDRRRLGAVGQAGGSVARRPGTQCCCCVVLRRSGGVCAVEGFGGLLRAFAQGYQALCGTCCMLLTYAMRLSYHRRGREGLAGRALEGDVWVWLSC